MQQPMDDYVCGINTQKVFSLGDIYFSRDKHVPVKFWYKRRNDYAVA